MSEPGILIDVSIANLRSLATYFAEELGGAAQSLSSSSLEARACKEALLTIGVLIPKLQIARDLVAIESPPGTRCVNCDDA